MKLAIGKIISDVFKRASFVQNGKQFQYSSSDVTLSVELSPVLMKQRYIDLGFWIRTLGGKTAPSRLAEYHIRARLERLFPEHREAILQALVSEAETNDVLNLAEVLESEIVPILRSMTTESTLRRSFGEGRLKGALILVEAQCYFGEMGIDEESGPENFLN